MVKNRSAWIVAAAWLAAASAAMEGRTQSSDPLPEGVRAVWDLAKAHRESTPTRQRVAINGLWRWQPAKDAADAPPDDAWGFFKVPGAWPGITSWIQKDCQTVFAHPSWKGDRLSGVAAAWYQREITIPREWAGRRVVLEAEYVNSLATVWIDGRRAGDLRFPAGRLDLTPHCRPGETCVLSIHVAALPLRGVMVSYSDTAAAREVRGAVARRGLCGDVHLVGEPLGPRIAHVRVDTWVRRGEITVHD